MQTSIIAAWYLCSMKAMIVIGVLNSFTQFHVYKVSVAMTYMIEWKSGIWHIQPT